MDRETLLVVGRLRSRLAARLEASATDFQVVRGVSPEEFREAAPDATVVLSWGASGEQLGRLLATCPKVRWVHVMSAGLDTVFSKELVESPATLTNGRGVFSATLGEWVLGVILFFAKDFRRLLASQAQGRWEPFDVIDVSGQTVGIVGYGDIGRAVAMRVRAMGMRVLGVTRRGPRLGRSDDLAEEIFSRPIGSA